jgi:hypothetical protein
VDADPRATPQADPGTPERSGRASGEGWRQRAGFSLFIEDLSDGGCSRRTRIYHDESGEEATFTQFEPIGLAVWMLRRLPPAAADSPAPPPIAPDDAPSAADDSGGWHQVGRAIRSIRQRRRQSRIECGRYEGVALVIWRRRLPGRSG